MSDVMGGFQDPALDGIALPSGLAFSIDLAGPAARWIFRGNGNAAAIAGTAFGLTLPQSPCDAAHDDEKAALWLGLGEWLLLDTPDNAAAAEERMRTALSDHSHALVGVSHRQIGLEVTGANAARALSAGCPLDFYRTAFPVDMVARTIFMKIEIMVWRRGEAHFRVETGRSYAPYLVRHLIEAARHAPPI